MLGSQHTQFIAENALLRQQLNIPSRQVKRPAYRMADRMLLVLLARLVRTWKQALFIVQPETLLCWHRELFRLGWKRKSQAASHPILYYELIRSIFLNPILSPLFRCDCPADQNSLIDRVADNW
jgi:putative transposase